MVLSDLKDLSGIFAFLISVGTLVYAWLTSRSRINSEHLKSVDDKLDTHDERLNRHGGKLDKIETELGHMPNKDDVTDLKLNLSKLEGTVGRLEEVTKGMGNTVHRVEEFLMQKGNSK